MYIENAYKSLHEGWRYLVGFLMIFILGWQFLGIIPISLISFKRSKDASDFALQSETMFANLYDNESNLYLILMILTFVGGFIALFFVVKYLHKQTWTNFTTARKKIDFKRIFFSFFIWTIFSVLSTLLAYYLSPETMILNFNLIPFLGLLAITFLLLPIQTSFEEYLFRGYLMQGIGVAAKNKWLPLIITSLIFGLMHIMNPEIEKLGYSILSVYIGLGFFLGIITLLDDGLELALGFHAANNMITALLVTTDWTVLQTNSVFKDVSEPEAGLDIILPIFVALTIMFFILNKKYKWSNHKEKLFGKVDDNQSEKKLINEIGIE